MTATGHAVIGTVIAAKFSNPALAIPLAVASHFLADWIPHWDSGTNEPKKGRARVRFEAYFDVIIGFIVSYAILVMFFPNTDLFYAFIIIIASQSLDWITAPYYFFHIDKPPFNWSYRLQKMFDHEMDAPWGIIIQIAILALLIFLAKIF